MGPGDRSRSLRPAAVLIPQSRRPELRDPAMRSTIDFSHYLKKAGSDRLHLDLAVEGINCAGCMAKIERNLSKMPDVISARINLTDCRLALEWKAGAVDPAVFVDRLTELGYKAYPFER